MKDDQILKGCSRNFKEFFKWSKDIIKSNNKKLDIRNVSYLRTGGRHMGSFDGDTIIIARKTSSKKFEEVYVHEFSHLCQVIEDSDLWNNVKDETYHHIEEKDIRITDWEGIYSIILLERDCELRALEYSKRFNLFNNEGYAQRANLYLYFYQFIYLYGGWVNTKTLYNRSIIKLMPTEIVSEEALKNVDMDMMMMYYKYLG